ncbi:MAG: RNA polymerase sigma-70 factor [Salibacteraceae bacterium]
MSVLVKNKAQFETLFRAHYAPLVGYATKITEDPDAAADIVQQLFVNLWEKRSEIVVNGSVKSYLLRSTHNQCLNHIKHLKVRSQHQQHVSSDIPQSTLNEELEVEEFNVQVRNAIQALPKQCRKIFLMSRLQEKKYQEIADELSLSVKTVENQMGKALKQLRMELKPSEKPSMRVLRSIFWMLIGVSSVSVVIR